MKAAATVRDKVLSGTRSMSVPSVIEYVQIDWVELAKRLASHARGRIHGHILPAGSTVFRLPGHTWTHLCTYVA